MTPKTIKYHEYNYDEIWFWIDENITKRTKSITLSYDENDVLKVEGLKLVDLRPVK